MKNDAVRSILIILMLVFTVSLVGCLSDENRQSVQDPSVPCEWQEATDGSGGIKLPIVKEKGVVSYSVIFADHPSFPVNDTFIIPDEIEKRTNIKLEMMPIAQSSYAQKLSVQFASGDIPDVVLQISYDAVIRFKDKFFLNLWDYMQQGYMPNYANAFDILPNMNQFKEGKDEVYQFGAFNTGKTQPDVYYTAALYIRKDILDKNDLEIPRTNDELFYVLSTLKEIYPDSYPWTARGSLENPLMNIIWVLSPSYGVPLFITYQNHYYTLNTETNRWESALEKENFKNLIIFLNKCYAAGLLDKEIAVTSTKEWEQKIANGKSFFTTDWFLRPTMFMNALKETNPEFELVHMLPPKPEGGNQQIFCAEIFHEFNVVNKNVEAPETLLQLIDYMYYSREGSLLGQCGVEGATYTVDENKQIRFIPTSENDADPFGSRRALNGISLNGVAGISPSVFGYSYYVDPQSKVASGAELYEGHTIDPPNRLPFSDQEAAIVNQINQPLYELITAELLKMVIGERPISEWDDLIREADGAGAGELLGIMNDVQARLESYE